MALLPFKCTLIAVACADGFVYKALSGESKAFPALIKYLSIWWFLFDLFGTTTTAGGCKASYLPKHLFGCVVCAGNGQQAHTQRNETLIIRNTRNQFDSFVRWSSTELEVTFEEWKVFGAIWQSCRRCAVNFSEFPRSNQICNLKWSAMKYLLCLFFLTMACRGMKNEEKLRNSLCCQLSFSIGQHQMHWMYQLRKRPAKHSGNMCGEWSGASTCSNTSSK